MVPPDPPDRNTSPAAAVLPRQVQLAVAAGLVLLLGWQVLFAWRFQLLGPTAAPESPPQPAPAFRLDVNAAGPAEWMLLPGIGEKTAQAIIAHRARVGPFRTLADVDRVPGIGPVTLEAIAPYLVFPEPVPP